MTSRNYDIVVTISDASAFRTGNAVVGNTTAAVGYLAYVDTANNILKVKLANLLQEFSDSEYIHSNAITLTKTANGAINNNEALPFKANVMSGNVVTADSQILSIAPSPFIAEKNSFTQNPVVRLYSIYYPGEAYPPNENGNPTGILEGLSWPSIFPLRFAEIVGDTYNDLNYNVSYGGTHYMPYPASISGIEQTSEGRVNELSVTIFNVENIISRLIEDPFLSGNNISNSVIAYVNGEAVHGIDPRTVNKTPSQVGAPSSEAYKLLSRARSNNLLYSSSIVNYYGKANAAFDYAQTAEVNGEWKALREDSRDLLGGVVEIKTTFANFLDYWPEYSTVLDKTLNAVTVKNAMPYRVGDTVRLSTSDITAVITSIDNNQVIYTDSVLVGEYYGASLLIVNPDADPESYLEDKFRIDQLESLSEHTATFGLVSWLQYFKLALPKRKYYKNTCQWLYKGPECQYPGPGGLPIPGTNSVSPDDPIGINNVSGPSVEDICAKSLAACTLRKNSIHFGGFPGVGRTIPRA